MSDMNKFEDRVKLSIKNSGKKQREIAKISGITEGAISQWKQGIVKKAYADNLKKFARACNVNAEWLIDGSGNMVLSTPIANFEKIQKAHGRVPIISWDQLNDIASITRGIDLTKYDHAVSSSEHINDLTYAIRVRGDSMAPIFVEGDILIVDPTMKHAAGDYVIAKIGDKEATLKQLTQDGSDWYLKPVNPAYPIKQVDDTTVIIAVVLERISKFK